MLLYKSYSFCFIIIICDLLLSKVRIIKMYIPKVVIITISKLITMQNIICHFYTISTWSLLNQDFKFREI